MYTYTLRVCRSVQYHKTVKYTDKSYGYELKNIKKSKELAEQGFLPINCLMYSIHLVYFDSEKGRHYMGLKNFNNLLNKIGKSIRFKIRSIKKTIEMESRGCAIGNGRRLVGGKE